MGEETTHEEAASHEEETTHVYLSKQSVARLATTGSVSSFDAFRSATRDQLLTKFLSSSCVTGELSRAVSRRVRPEPVKKSKVTWFS